MSSYYFDNLQLLSLFVNFNITYGGKAFILTHTTSQYFFNPLSGKDCCRSIAKSLCAYRILLNFSPPHSCSKVSAGRPLLPHQVSCYVHALPAFLLHISSLLQFHSTFPAAIRTPTGLAGECGQIWCCRKGHLILSSWDVCPTVLPHVKPGANLKQVKSGQDHTNHWGIPLKCNNFDHLGETHQWLHPAEPKEMKSIFLTSLFFFYNSLLLVVLEVSISCVWVQRAPQAPALPPQLLSCMLGAQQWVCNCWGKSAFKCKERDLRTGGKMSRDKAETVSKRWNIHLRENLKADHYPKKILAVSNSLWCRRNIYPAAFR